MAEEQIRKLKAAKQQADVASAFTEARAAKLAEELADLRAQGQSAAAQHEQRMRDIAANAARAEECRRLQEEVQSCLPHQPLQCPWRPSRAWH